MQRVRDSQMLRDARQHRAPFCVGVAAGAFLCVAAALCAPLLRLGALSHDKATVPRSESPSTAGIWSVPVMRRRLHPAQDPRPKLGAAHHRYCSKHDRLAADIPVSREGRIQYLGAVGLGSPPQQFLVVFDTFSASLWVPGERCKQRRRRFDPAYSESFRGDPHRFTFHYGTGTGAGSLVADTMRLGNMTVPETPFLKALGTSPNLAEADFDGILGLAFGGVAEPEGMLAPLDAISRSKGSQMQKQVFSFQVDEDPDKMGQLLFGAINYSNYPRGVHWVDVQRPGEGKPYGHWALPLEAVDIGGIKSFGRVGIVDAGTGPLVMPVVDAKTFFKEAHMARARDLRCSALPTISLTVGGQVYTFTGDDYGFWEDHSCTIRIMATDEPVWILGDVFQRKYPVVFDFGSQPPRVGLPNVAAGHGLWWQFFTGALVLLLLVSSPWLHRSSPARLRSQVQTFSLQRGDLAYQLRRVMGAQSAEEDSGPAASPETQADRVVS